MPFKRGIRGGVQIGRTAQRLGMCLASAFIASPPAARVAMALSAGFHLGRSAAQSVRKLAG